MGLVLDRRSFIAAAGVAALCASTRPASKALAAGALPEAVEFSGLKASVPGQGLKTSRDGLAMFTYLAADIPFCVKFTAMAGGSMPSSEADVVPLCKEVVVSITDGGYGSVKFEDEPVKHGDLFAGAFSALDTNAGLKVRGEVVPVDGTFVVVAAEWPKQSDEPAEVEGILNSIEAAAGGSSFAAGGSGSGNGAIAWGERVATEDYDFILDGYSWEYIILPPDTSSSYGYYEVEAGSIYLVVSGALTNTSPTTIDLDRATWAQFLINDKYEFQGNVVTASPAAHDFYDDPKPLECVYVKIYASVPMAMYEQFQKAELTWRFGKDLTKYNYRSEDFGPSYVYELS